MWFSKLPPLHTRKGGETKRDESVLPPSREAEETPVRIVAKDDSLLPGKPVENTEEPWKIPLFIGILILSSLPVAWRYFKKIRKGL